MILSKCLGCKKSSQVQTCKLILPKRQKRSFATLTTEPDGDDDDADVADQRPHRGAELDRDEASAARNAP